MRHEELQEVNSVSRVSGATTWETGMRATALLLLLAILSTAASAGVAETPLGSPRLSTPSHHFGTAATSPNASWMVYWLCLAMVGAAIQRRSRRVARRFESLEPRELLTGAPEQFTRGGGLRDYDSFTGQPYDHVTLGGEIFFPADDGTGEVELWKTDGTSAGTFRVKDIRSGVQSSFPRELAAMNDRVLFTAYTEETGRELWSTDGTEGGTDLLTDIVPGPGSSEIATMVAADNLALFVQADSEVWRTDGTAEGTFRLMKFLSVGDVHKAGSKIYFSARTLDGTGHWFVSDGTIAGTTPLPIEGYLRNPLSFGESLAWTVETETPGLFEVHSTDGSPEGTRSFTVASETRVKLLPTENDLYLVSSIWDRSFLKEALWRADVTEGRTHHLRTFFVDGMISAHALEDVLYVATTPNGRSSSFWKTDGTIEGTVDIVTTPTPLWVRGTENSLFFTEPRDDGPVLWKIDETTVRPQLLPDGAPLPVPFADIGDTTLYWSSEEGRQALWAESPDSEELISIRDGLVGESGSSTHDLVLPQAIGDLFLNRSSWSFYSRNGVTTSVLQHPCVSVQLADDFYCMNATVDRDNRLVGLWRSDGTIDGTELLVEIDATRTSQSAESLTVAGSLLYFLGDRGEVYRSDGTAAGTYVIHDDGRYVSPYSFTAAGDKLLFYEYHSSSRGEETVFYVSDGTEEGTRSFAPLEGQQRVLRGTKTFGYALLSGGGIWALDLSGMGTQLLIEGLANNRADSIGDTLYFFAAHNEYKLGLWRTNGTIDGTEFVHGISADCDECRIVGPIVLGSELYFLHDQNLWKSDGTENGTAVVTAGVRTMIGIGKDAIYLTIADEISGTELWQTDGTLEGTVQLTDINPGSDSSVESTRAVEAGDFVYFLADDGFHGEEFWRIRLAPTPGDTDGNRTVDFADYLLFSANFGKSTDAVFGEGDFDGDGTVGFMDYLILAANFDG